MIVMIETCLQFFSPLSSWTRFLFLSRARSLARSLLSSVPPQEPSTSLPAEFGLDQGCLVLARGVVPRQVLAHAVELQRLKAVGVVAVREDGVAERIDHRLPRAFVKGPARAEIGGWVELLDGVAQAPNRVDDWHRAVLHRVQLIQAAWLEARGHEEDVACRCDAVRHFDGEADPRANFLWVRLLHFAEHILEVLSAGAEKDDLALLLHEPVPRLTDDVDAFLLVEPADEADERYVVALGPAHLALERPLALELSLLEAFDGARKVDVPVAREELIDSGVPLVGVDSVDDAAHLAIHHPERRREAPTPHIRLAFPRVPVAHGDDVGAADETSLEGVAARTAHRVIEDERLLVVFWYTVLVKVSHRTAPLVRQVVHHHRAARERELIVILVVGPQKHGKERRVPVVRHEEEVLVAVRDAAARGMPDGFDGRLTEHRVTKPELVARAAVDGPRVLAVLFVVDKDVVHAILVNVPVLHLHHLPAHAERVPLPEMLRVRVVLVHRCDAHDSVPAPRERLWERSRNVAQPARLGPRRALRRRHHHVEHLLRNHLVLALGWRRSIRNGRHHRPPRRSLREGWH
mmetsp:Transcript_22606/g.73488  ORF Transcript_22606/g.73488 Transcript_22606/m.73488 type:complete len:577 (-) Transcript_22606:175-1905(-)